MSHYMLICTSLLIVIVMMAYQTTFSVLVIQMVLIHHAHSAFTLESRVVLAINARSVTFIIEIVKFQY